MINKYNNSNKDVKYLYKNFLNIGQVGLLDKFDFSEDKIVQAKKCTLYTESGREILDLTSGFGTQNLGYNNDKIISERIAFANNNELPFSRLFFNEDVAKLAKKISSMLPGSLQYSFFSNSGAEANEGALKLAFKYHNGQRKLLIHNKDSFHGKLIATSQITNSPEVYFDFQSSLETDCIDLSNTDLLEEKVLKNKDNIYAIIIEPFSASLARPIDFKTLLKIQEICNREDIVLIFDEVYSGFFRTSNLFYFMNESDLLPDIVTYSKSFGGGISSVSGYTTKEKVFTKAYGSQKDALLHSSTYSNYVEESRVALKALSIFSNTNFQEEINQKRKYFIKKIHEITNLKYVESLTGDGFHWGIGFEKIKLLNLDKLLKLLPLEITKDPRFAEKLYVSSIINELYRKYNILSYAGFNSEIKLFISPPIIISEQEIDHAVESIIKTVEKKPLVLMTSFVQNYLLRFLNKN
ncbi:MAG: hypothetical protein CMC31_03310 [Flavobacteriaceae bacterium]|nr:hypothetical protein [Flavobacteriaceae bacterium]